MGTKDPSPGGRRAPGPSDPDRGTWQGRSVARRFVAPDGSVILVGRTAADNDLLTFRLASPRDFWLHVAAESGSHVVVRNPDGLERLPRDTAQLAASLAVRHSRARHGGRVAVHLARCADVSKPRGFPPGKVIVDRYTTLRSVPFRDEADVPEGEEG